MKIEIQVAALGFATEGPELHHYTDLKGLRDIVEGKPRISCGNLAPPINRIDRCS
jgi:hypothetical protein